MIRRAFVLLSLLVLLAPAALQAQGPVKIGLLLPYTGVLSVQGTDTTRGFELYLGKVGAKAGGREIQVLKEDTEAKPDVGLTKIKKLMRTEKQGGRIINAIIDKMPSVSQEQTWGWWNKK